MVVFTGVIDAILLRRNCLAPSPDTPGEGVRACCLQRHVRFPHLDTFRAYDAPIRLRDDVSGWSFK